MQESTIPLITAITTLGVITLLFFVNEFFRKYKIVKKRKPRNRKQVQKFKPITQDVENAINLQFIQFEEMDKDKHSKPITTYQTL